MIVAAGHEGGRGRLGELQLDQVVLLAGRAVPASSASEVQLTGKGPLQRAQLRHRLPLARRALRIAAILPADRSTG